MFIILLLACETHLLYTPTSLWSELVEDGSGSFVELVASSESSQLRVAVEGIASCEAKGGATQDAGPGEGIESD